MKNIIVDNYFKDNIFIIGDAAHQFPPSGGYGLNIGISDAYNLSWVMKYLLNMKDEKEKEVLKNTFQKERQIHSAFVSKCAGKNYNKFLDCCDVLGLKVNYSEMLQNLILNSLPKTFQNSFFSSFMEIGVSMGVFLNTSKLVKHLSIKSNHINLIFPYIDYGLNFQDKKKIQLRNMKL